MPDHEPYRGARIHSITDGIEIVAIAATTDANALRFLADWIEEHDATLVQLLSSPEGGPDDQYDGYYGGVYFQATIERGKEADA